jgi:calcium-dependent protein kinase
MECLEGGELYERVVQKGKLPERESVEAVRQMLLVLAYLHGRGIVHRDVKLENFLFDEPNGNHLKLVDFGLSAFYQAGDAQLQTKCGTIDYVAPEVLKGGYTESCDMWSLGVVAFILLSGGMPFNGKHGDARRKIMQGSYCMREEKWAPVSHQGRNFVRSLLDMDPNRRLTAQAALMHPWIASSGNAGGSIESSIVESLRAFPFLPRFRRLSLSVLPWSLSRNDHSQLREAFLAMDTRCRGVITSDELRTALVDQFGAEEHEVAGVLASVQSLRGGNCSSVDCNSEIRYSEFLAAMAPSKVALNDDLLQASFRRFDECGSGRIAPHDLRRVVGNSFDGMDVDALMYEVSYMKDRSISYPEFVDLIRGSQKQCPKRPPLTPQSSHQQLPLGPQLTQGGFPRDSMHPMHRQVTLPPRRSHDDFGVEGSKGGRSCCSTGGSNECSFM